MPPGAAAAATRCPPHWRAERSVGRGARRPCAAWRRRPRRPRRAAADVERQRTGQQRRGKAPAPGKAPPNAKAQSHWTAPERPRMRTTHQGWEDGGQAPARVDGAWQSIVACDGTAASNDQPPAAPVAQATLTPLVQAGLERSKDVAGALPALPATGEHGADRAAAGQALETFGGAPASAPEPPRHPMPQTAAPETPATVPERLAATGRTPRGQAWDARRQGMVAPGFGQSTAARGCRRCWLRGLATSRGAWRLVCLPPPLLKRWRYGQRLRVVSPGWRRMDGLAMALRRAS